MLTTGYSIEVGVRVANDRPQGFAFAYRGQQVAADEREFFWGVRLGPVFVVVKKATAEPALVERMETA